MTEFSTKRVMNTKDVYCLFVDDNPIGTATWRDGIASATVTYDDEIKYFNNDESLYDMLSEILEYIRGVEQYYNEAADEAADEAEYHNIAANYDELADAELAKEEQEAEEGRMFIGGWELK